MTRFIARRLITVFTVFVVVTFSHGTLAEDAPEGAALIEAQLAEAKKLLAEDQASFKDTAEKKRMVDEKLAQRRAREEQIQAELKLLCEEQEALSPGTLDSCMAKLNN